MGDEFLSNQLIKLGDMMGDGLHHEEGGEWIEKEYRRVSKILYPEAYMEVRRKKAASRNEFVAKMLVTQKCECGGELVQTRSGARKVKCKECGLKYVWKARKKKNSDPTAQECDATDVQ